MGKIQNELSIGKREGKVMKRKNLLLLVMLFTFALVGLGDITVKAAGVVKLNKKNVVLDIGKTYQLRMKNTTDQVKWKSFDKKVVKVSKKGKLTPVAVGSTKVTATVNNKRYTCKVAVLDSSSMTDGQKEVVSYALKYVGNPYSYGGISLTKGADCSGFTMSVYKRFGYSLDHNAYMQLKNTTKVKLKNIQPGDLVFYGSSKKDCSHVALYIGNGKIVHASDYDTGIIVSDYKYSKAVGVGRVLEEQAYPDEESGEQSDTQQEITE